mgnify:CR=1 FL=1
MNVRISNRGRVVIPAALRRKYKLYTGVKVQIIDHGGVLALVPQEDSPQPAAAIRPRSKRPLTQALLAERRTEGRREKSRSG